jgi:hypothetical protein
MFAVAHEREVPLVIEVFPPQVEQFTTPERTMHGNSDQVHYRLFALGVFGEPFKNLLDLLRRRATLAPLA